MDTGSLRDWSDELERKNRRSELTQGEAGLLASLYIHANLVQLNRRLDALADSTEHQEGMLGAIDALAAGLATRIGLPYPSSAKIRAAMDEIRDRERLAARGDHKELQDG